MAGLKTFLPTEGADAGDLFDADGARILITETGAREAIAGVVVPVDIGTRPNANDGDPLRTSFTKLNNFLLASYQNDSDVQERVGALEAGSVFLGLFRADRLPRRFLPERSFRPWVNGITDWPDDTGTTYDQHEEASVPDVLNNPTATPVYAMLSRAIDGTPALSVVIDGITDTSLSGVITVTVIFPTEITNLPEPATNFNQAQLIALGDSAVTPFPAFQVQVQVGGMVNTAAQIAGALESELNNIQGSDNYFRIAVDAPSDDVRALIIDYSVRADTAADAKIPPVLVVVDTSAMVLDSYVAGLTLSSNGNTRGEGILALPWIDQDIQGVIPAYTVLRWGIEGWSIADEGRGDIKAEFLYFEDDGRTASEKVLARNSDDVVTINPSTKEILEDGTRDAIVDVQQFGIDYVHSVTIDAGTY